MNALIKRLKLSQEDWVGIMTEGLFFKNSCCTLGLTIKIKTGVEVIAASLTETFDSVFLKESENFTIQNDPNNYDAISMENSSSQYFLQRIKNIFCCAA